MDNHKASSDASVLRLWRVSTYTRHKCPAKYASYTTHLLLGREATGKSCCLSKGDYERDAHRENQ